MGSRGVRPGQRPEEASSVHLICGRDVVRASSRDTRRSPINVRGSRLVACSAMTGRLPAGLATAREAARRRLSDCGSGRPGTRSRTSFPRTGGGRLLPFGGASSQVAATDSASTYRCTCCCECGSPVRAIACPRASASTGPKVSVGAPPRGVVIAGTIAVAAVTTSALRPAPVSGGAHAVVIAGSRVVARPWPIAPLRSPVMAGLQAPPSASPWVASIAGSIAPLESTTIAWSDARPYVSLHAGLCASKRDHLRAAFNAPPVGCVHVAPRAHVSASGHVRSAAPRRSWADARMQVRGRAAARPCACAVSRGRVHGRPPRYVRAGEPASLLAHTSRRQHAYLSGPIELHLIAGVLGPARARSSACVLSSATAGGHTRSRAPAGVSLPPPLRPRMPRSSRASADAHTDRWTADRPLITSADHRST